MVPTPARSGRCLRDVFRSLHSSTTLLGSGGDDVQEVLVEVQSLWFVVGGSGPPLQQGQTREPDLQAEKHGENPRPTSHINIGFAILGGSFLGSNSCFRDGVTSV
jgi:hypothetical protein